MLIRPLSFLLIALVAMAASTVSQAHELRPSVANISISSAEGQRTASVMIRANLERIITEIGPDHDDSDSSPQRIRYESLRAMNSADLTGEFDPFRVRFREGVNILNNSGEKIALKNISVTIPEVGNIEIPRDTVIAFDLELKSTDQSISWGWDENFGQIIVRADDESSDDNTSVMLTAGQRSGEIVLGNITALTIAGTIANYIVVGFQHIIPKGLDHILFVIGLFLLTANPSALLLQVTVFTIAHTITLMLGTLDVLKVSGHIVEPLIALSIVFVCVENLFHSKTTRWRFSIVFLFGLLHGLGFASVLGEVGLDVQHFFTALLSFNVGVELGQLSVIAGCYLLLGAFAKKHWYRRFISLPLSVIIGGTGLFWFGQRILA